MGGHGRAGGRGGDVVPQPRHVKKEVADQTSVCLSLSPLAATQPYPRLGLDVYEWPLSVPSSVVCLATSSAGALPCRYRMYMATRAVTSLSTAGEASTCTTMGHTHR